MSVNGYIILKKSLLCKPLTCINNFFTAKITLFLNTNMLVSSTRRKDRKTIGTYHSHKKNSTWYYEKTKQPKHKRKEFSKVSQKHTLAS